MSTSDEKILELLTELRDGQQQHLALYRDVAQRSLDTQQTAIELQRRASRFYRVVVAVGAVLIAGLIAGLIVFLYSLPI